MRLAILLVPLAFPVLVRTAPASDLTFACDERNDLYRCVVAGGTHAPRFDSPADAVDHAAEGSGVLLLANGYPARRLLVDERTLAAARLKRLRLYVEYPDTFPGLQFQPAVAAKWERAVVATDALARPLEKLHILAVHECTFLPIKPPAAPPPGSPLLVLARVAGYDTAVYGLPADSHPLLFTTGRGDLVACTKLSGFVTGRYAPAGDWVALWREVFSILRPGEAPPPLVVSPAVRAAYSKSDPLPPGAEAEALGAYAAWIRNSGLLAPAARREDFDRLLRRGVEITDPPGVDEPRGDGALGLLEGYASQIRPDGGQSRRLPLRADCHGEAAMVLALQSALSGDRRARDVAANLLDFVYSASGMCRGAFGDPKHPAYGLVAWGDVAPAWTVATYGDDNARALLGTVCSAACLGETRWDASILRGLTANLRTTGRLGFRGDRIDVPALERNGWRHYHDAETFNPALNFEAYPWATFLWAYRHTGETEFLDRARTAIEKTMAAYPQGWRWGDNTERARALLPLAWLVRVDDTPGHRRWLATVAADLLRDQEACGAIREHLGRDGKGAGHYVVPSSNEAYGTTETPLIQRNGDPVSDQLYNTGFALIGLHEAAAATGDPELRRAEDRLADYLVRIQVRSEAVPYLNGAWFRAFDYQRWECWASSADMGWGAWSVEAGWGPAWAATALGLRAKKTSLWELTAGSTIGSRLDAVRAEMSANDGGPFTGR